MIAIQTVSHQALSLTHRRHSNLDTDSMDDLDEDEEEDDEV